MLAEMPAGLLDEWSAYFELEPWGQEWDQAGTIAAVIHNAMLPIHQCLGIKDGRPTEPADFMPHIKTKRRKRRLTDAEDQAMGRARAGV